MKRAKYLPFVFSCMCALGTPASTPNWEPRVMAPITQCCEVVTVEPNAQTGPGTAVERLDANTLRIYFTSDDIPTVLSPGQYDIYYVDFDVASGTFGPAHDIDCISSDPINTSGHDQGPSLSPDGNYLFFLRLGSGGDYDHEIWMAQKDMDGKWSNPHKLPSTINSGHDEHTGSYRDGKLYFDAKGRDGGSTFDIWVCDFDPETEVADNFSKVVFDSWSSDAINEAHAFITSDGARIYLSAYDPPAIANHDIYYSDWADLGEGIWGWSEPQVLGSNVNGSGHEVTPTLSDDQEFLFFTSTSSPATTNKLFYCEKGEDVATLLQSFDSKAKDGAITIRWTLFEAGENMKFFLLCAESGSDTFKELESAIIENVGLTYTFTDEDCRPGATYRYRVDVQDENGRRILFETDSITLPQISLKLYQNYPNPFNPITKIRYYLPEETHVILEICDVEGKRIACLIDKEQAKGEHFVEWNGRDKNGQGVSTGIYFYRLKAGNLAIARKMVLVK